MLNQNNSYFNNILTYLDQGGNNIWWSANTITSSQPIAELVINGNGIDPTCIDPTCNPICSTIIESEQQSIETLQKNQSLIYPTFSITPDQIQITLNNLSLIEQPNYIEEGCINEECVEEYGIWTKAFKTSKSTTIEGETYYFIKCSLDKYNYAYVYTLSLIHEETGEEIVLTKQKGLLDPIVIWNQGIPEGFNPCISVTKFDIQQVITTYKFVSSPLYLRSNWGNNLVWQPTDNNVEEVLLSIIYLLYTDLEVYNKNELVLYKQPQETLINYLLATIKSISNISSNPYSYIKTSTIPSDFNSLVTDALQELEDIVLNPAVYSTTTYTERPLNNTVLILLLLVLSKTNNILTSFNLDTYINLCINLETVSLKEDVLKLIALVEAYKITKDVYHLSIATTTIENIIKVYKITNGHYIESLNNPTQTIESKVFGDLFEVYTTNKQIDLQDYTLENITYISDTTETLYLLNQPTLLTNDPINLLILKLIGVDLNYNLPSNSKLIIDVLKLENTRNISEQLLDCLDLFKQEVYLKFKSYIPTDFGWLSDLTPNMDLIIKCSIKPIIDLYIHSKYITDFYIQKEALTSSFTDNIITNTKELLPKTIQTGELINNSLWPGRYSNSVDIEIQGYYDTDIINEINNNVKSLGIETNLVSTLEMPIVSNFNLCIDIVQLQDYRCQVDINGQLILLNDGQCNLAPPVVEIILQENTSPVTQESSINDYFII